MKTRIISGLVVSFLMLSLIGCSLEGTTVDVRFQNNTDFILYYGVKFGDAEYLGEVAPGFISGYYTIEAGTYSLQAMNSSGSWVTISTGSMTVLPGNGYTIVGTGTGGTYYWTLVQDY